MKRLVLVAVLAVVVLPATARAAAPCRDKVFNDWYADGKIASTYPHACYVDALHHLPTDAAVYSSLGDDITMAMRAALARAAGKKEPAQVGHGFPKTAQNVLVSAQTAAHNPALGEKSASGGLVASASNAPLPILVLGGLALALVAAGAIGSGLKYVRSRRG
ncbi:MAG TPA: hypothetical protein VNC40_02095 [Gaiellaceae bacterium]|nr:hypothetical protein [Gaiellaceae bacterium]